MNRHTRSDRFRQFPKRRPALPEPYRHLFAQHYRANREGGTPASSWSQKMESWLHRQVARDVCHGRRCRATLEIGAGTLNHLPYEPEVEPYDIVEPFTSLFQGSPLLRRIRHLYTDVADIPLSCRYDRIISVATFEHICNLPDIVARCGLLLEPTGCLRVAIPSEGTLLWKLGWKLTTGLEFRMRYGLDYGVIVAHEHVNTADEIARILEYFFARVATTVCGVSKALSFYQFYACYTPDRSRCRDYIEQLAT